MAAEREPVIGIDLGTTNSVVATVQSGSPVVIRGRSGSNLLPSVVSGSASWSSQYCSKRSVARPRPRR